jgi:hypothetical protein
MKYAVMIEPFEDGLEYVSQAWSDKGMWVTNGKPKVYESKLMAKQEADQWNTGVVVEYRG